MLRELQKAADESAFRFKIDSEVTVVEEPDPSPGRAGAVRCLTNRTGSYHAEALAKAIDPDTGEVVGNVTAEITLNVQ